MIYWLIASVIYLAMVCLIHAGLKAQCNGVARRCYGEFDWTFKRRLELLLRAAIWPWTVFWIYWSRRKNKGGWRGGCGRG